MSDELKVLGQSMPAAATLTDLYTVPNLAQTTVSTIVVTNHDPGNDSVRVSIAVGGATDSDEQYILRDFDLGSYLNKPLTYGITLGQGDVIRVYSTNGTCSFNAFGVETT